VVIKGIWRGFNLGFGVFYQGAFQRGVPLSLGQRGLFLGVFLHRFGSNWLVGAVDEHLVPWVFFYIISLLGFPAPI